VLQMLRKAHAASFETDLDIKRRHLEPQLRTVELDCIAARLEIQHLRRGLSGEMAVQRPEHRIEIQLDDGVREWLMHRELDGSPYGIAGGEDRGTATGGVGQLNRLDLRRW